VSIMLDPCSTPDCNDPVTTLLGADPFTSLRPHFGMLLGVDDFETLDANPRGKTRLHNAWLHGEGAVWGLAVQIDRDAGELEVFPGLGLDAAGRELYLPGKVCLSLSSWFAEHREELGIDLAAGPSPFVGHVVIRSRPCLARQVPAFADECNGSETATAYSRVEESVELLLRPGHAPVRGVPYHRLRLMYGLDPASVDQDGAVVPEDREVMDRLAAIASMPAASQPAAAVEAFRDFVAWDTVDLRPGVLPDEESDLLYPGGDDSELILAEVAGRLEQQGAAIVLTASRADVTVRPAHVATRTIQELTLAAVRQAADAGGPRIDPQAVTRSGARITIPVTASLHADSVNGRAFSVSTFANGGWDEETIAATTYDDPTRTITVRLPSAPTADRLRLIARGTGPFPLLGSDLVPLAGSIGGPPGSDDDGHDFVLMMRSQP
jgi:hypothetical protein